METSLTTSRRATLSRLLHLTPLAILLPLLILLLTAPDGRAASATWKSNPVDGNWNNPSNWSPEVVPDEVATFDTSTITAITLDPNSGGASLNSIVFDAGASAYTITVFASQSSGILTMDLNGAGITNNSGVTQNLVAQSEIGGVEGDLNFHGSASAGDNTILTAANGGRINFLDNSTAASSTIIGLGSAAMGSNAGQTFFIDNATAANSTLIENSGSGTGGGAFVDFINSSPAAGGTARVQLFGNQGGDVTNGALSLDADLVIGSLEGSGRVLLGSYRLTVGSNNLSTVFSGLLRDFLGFFGKTGTGTLTLTNANAYANPTFVTKGTLLANNRAGSATGSGQVTVIGGTLGGTGAVAGNVTIGTATSVATLAPGVKKTPGGLSVTNDVTFNARGKFQVNLDSNRSSADQLTCKSVSIVSGATIEVRDSGTGTLPSGTSFTIISNNSGGGIRGTFANLPNGSTLTVGNSTYVANYQGGTGNDLTLTVQ